MPGPLEGIKVLDFTEVIAGPLAGRILADLGADVIKAEEHGGDRSRQRGPFPGGQADPEQSGLFLSLNTNKRSVSVDFTQDKDKAFKDYQYILKELRIKK